jgi:hypothetical protein
MRNKGTIFCFLLLFLLIIFVSSYPGVYASSSDNDWMASSGIAVDDIITVLSSILATILLILTFFAYKRSGRNKLLFVCIAFLLFAIKGLLMASDIFFPNKGAWVDPTAAFLDFAILLSFFFGILKK